LGLAPLLGSRDFSESRIMKLSYLTIIFTMNTCATYTHGPYNHDTFQDPSCYAKYGGQYGYCDRSIYYVPGETPK